MKALISMVCIAGCTLLFAVNGLAASARCTIIKIEGKKMIVNCSKGTERFKEGGTVKIKSSDKKKIEGC